MKKEVEAQKAILKQTKHVQKHADDEGSVQSLFKDKDKKHGKEAKSEGLKQREAMEQQRKEEGQRLVEQQKQMLVQQQKAIKDDTHKAGNADVDKLFHKHEDVKQAESKPHAKSKEERANEALVAQQKQMLEQQKKVIDE